MTIALIDADIVGYRVAAASENDPEDICLLRVDKLMRDILEETGAEGYLSFITGPNNFRYEIYPEYKANRKDTPRPRHLPAVRQFLQDEWEAIVCDGYEADDALGMYQDKIDETTWEKVGEVAYQWPNTSTIICSIDKDLLMIPGNHYNFVKKEFAVVDELIGIRNLYKQALAGDKADNIFGWDGLARSSIPKKIHKLIDPLDNEVDMYNTVCKLYNDPDRLEMNLDCLWIWRNLGERWSDRFAP